MARLLIKRLFGVMVTALEQRRNVPVTPSVTPAVLPTDSPTDSPGSKKTDDATVTPSVLPADSTGSKKDNDDEAQNSKNWCEKIQLTIHQLKEEHKADMERNSLTFFRQRFTCCR